MSRKDCEFRSSENRGRQALRCAALAWVILLCARAAHAGDGHLRVWSSAVVVSDSITLGDLADLDLSDSEELDALRKTVITEAPPPGGSRIVHYAMIRAALTANGVNLARLSLGGSTQCEVRRPAAPLQMAYNAHDAAYRNRRQPLPGGEGGGVDDRAEARTLRQAIEERLRQDFAPYGGRVEVVFDRKDNQILELTGPPLEFRLQMEKETPIGLCAVQVEVVKEGKVVQQIPLVTRTVFTRTVMTARRAINQGATIVPADVELTAVAMSRLDDVGVSDASLVLGQRAKRFIPAGSRLELETLDAVPLVLRGQLITLISEVGSVRIVTTAKAAANGMRGETIRVRSVDDQKTEIDAVVTGPGQAHAAGAYAAGGSEPRLVLGGSP